MAKNLFDGLSPQAAFASKLLAAAGLDLAELMTAGDVNALKLKIDAAKTNPDLAAAITEATNKLSGELATATTELATAKSELKTAQTNFETFLTPLTASLEKAGIKLADCKSSAGAFEAAKFESAHKLVVATAARAELARHGIATPLPEQVTGGDQTKKTEKKVGEGLTGSAKVQALFAADPTVAKATAEAAARR